MSVERVRDLYTIICNGQLGDAPRDVDTRVDIIRELERLTGRGFRDTSEFHYVISDYLKRQSGSRDTVGTRFRRARKRVGLSQVALAEILGVTRRQIIDFEQNTYPLPPRGIEWLAENGATTDANGGGHGGGDAQSCAHVSGRVGGLHG